MAVDCTKSNHLMIKDYSENPNSPDIKYGKNATELNLGCIELPFIQSIKEDNVCNELEDIYPVTILPERAEEEAITDSIQMEQKYQENDIYKDLEAKKILRKNKLRKKLRRMVKKNNWKVQRKIKFAHLNLGSEITCFQESNAECNTSTENNFSCETSSMEFCPQQFLFRVGDTSCDVSGVDKVEEMYFSLDDIKETSLGDGNLEDETLNVENTSQTTEENCKSNDTPTENASNELEEKLVAERSEHMDKDEEQKLNNNYNDGKRNEKMLAKNKLRRKLRRMVKNNNWEKKRNKKTAHLNIFSEICYLQSLNEYCTSSERSCHSNVSSIEFCQQQVRNSSPLPVLSAVRDTTYSLSRVDKMKKSYSFSDSALKISPIDENVIEESFDNSYFEYMESSSLRNEENCKINSIEKGDCNDISAVAAVEEENFQNHEKYFIGENCELQSNAADVESMKSSDHSLPEITSVDLCQQQMRNSPPLLVSSIVTDTSCSVSDADKMEENYSLYDNTKKISPIDENLIEEVFDDSYFEYMESTSLQTDENLKINGIEKDGSDKIPTVASAKEENFQDSVKYFHGGNCELPASTADLETTESSHHSIPEISSVDFGQQEMRYSSPLLASSIVRATSCSASGADKMEKSYSFCDNAKKLSSIDEILIEEAFDDSYLEYMESASLAHEENCRINGIEKCDNRNMWKEPKENRPVSSSLERSEKKSNIESIPLDQQWNYSHEKKNEKVLRRNALKAKLRKIIRKDVKHSKTCRITAYFSLATQCRILPHKDSNVELPTRNENQNHQRCDSPNMETVVDCINLNGLASEDQLTEGDAQNQSDKNCSVLLLAEKKDDSDSFPSGKEAQNNTCLNEGRVKKVPRKRLRRKVLKKNSKKVERKTEKKYSKLVSECKVSPFQTCSIKYHTRNIPQRDKRKFLSKVCKAPFVSKSTQKQHKVKHSKFACATCGKQFPFKSRLELHERVRHTEERPFTCIICKICFKEMSSLKRHKLIHTGKMPFTCSECGKKFRRNAHLVIHRRLHSNDLPFSCGTCGKKFNSKAQLKNHERNHTGEKKIIHSLFCCYICEKQFPTLQRLSNHIRVHTGEKPYSCDTCGKDFKEIGGLKRHMKIHTGKKPFSCSECGKKLSRKYYLTAHEKLHTREKPFICSQCGKKFAVKSYLTNHEKFHSKRRKTK